MYGCVQVGVAQQWYDELDTLALSTPESESNIEDETTTSDLRSEDDTVHIDCAVNTSPGTSEVCCIFLSLSSLLSPFLSVCSVIFFFSFLNFMVKKSSPEHRRKSICNFTDIIRIYLMKK